ncbi:MAG: molecular chaperone DnaJ [Bacteriovoracaceae bacterium]|nr:molecular chaperone DnaJ [Bacteriovoracaceae bacterium]
MSTKRDYYEILGLAKGAGTDEIKKAYRKLAMRYHPDRNPGNKESENKFKEASEAAEVLLNDEKRSRYDQFGHAGVNGQAGGFGGSHDFSDLGDIFGDLFGRDSGFFGDIFGGTGRSRRGSRNNPGANLQMSLTVEFNEAVFGAEKTMSVVKKVMCDSCNGSGGEKGAQPITCNQCNGYGEVRRQQGFFTLSSTCPRCQGSGQVISNPCHKCHGEGLVKKKVDILVKVPAGIDHEQRLRLPGEGEMGRFGGPPGDLYVVVKILEHDFFVRDEFDIHCTVPITFSQAALGASIEVPTLNGKVAVNIPLATQSGKKMRLKNKGVVKLGGYGHGDQILTIHVETPSKLCSEQKELFKKLSAYDNGNCNPMGRGFFNKVKNLFQ